MEASDKYGRCLHAKISLGTTSDDRFMPDGYVKVFAEMINGHALTEKLDGQNNCFKKSGVYARSHVTPTAHPWDKPMRERWELIKNDLGHLELFGENMYGIHSVAYSKLESYYYMFAAREKGHWLSWEEVKWYAEVFDFPVVPEIPIKISLKDFLKGKEGLDENKVLAEWFTEILGMPWDESIHTSGLLGGYDPETGNPASEGFVLRNVDGYESRNSGVLDVQENEFNNLFKLVRPGHVKTDDKHWTKTWKEAELVDYSKYRWDSYFYISNNKV